MLLAAAFSLFLASQSAELALVAAFDGHCARLDGVEAMEQRLAAAQWTKFAPAPDSELSKLTAAIAGPDRTFRVDTRTFRRAAEPDVVILVSQMTAPDGTGSIECRALNELAGKPDVNSLIAWAGKKPARTSDKDGVLVWAWQPGRSPDQPFTAITYSPANDKRRFPGVGLSVGTVKFLP